MDRHGHAGFCVCVLWVRHFIPALTLSTHTGVRCVPGWIVIESSCAVARSMPATFSSSIFPQGGGGWSYDGIGVKGSNNLGLIVQSNDVLDVDPRLLSILTLLYNVIIHAFRKRQKRLLI